MLMAHIQQAADEENSNLIALAGIMAIVAILTIVMVAAGIDVTPAINWPTTHVHGPGGHPTFLPPAR